MKTLFYSSCIFLLSVSVCAQQQKEQDSLQGTPVALDEVLVSAVRVDAQTPVTFSNFTKEEIDDRNLGQDIPVLINYLPSVVTTSDAGAGIGYTGIRVRGSDATRVNITINGIPYNDAESQGTFWVNLPDFASSVESLQLQRGVGTSTNGAGAFGASLNLLTDLVSEEANGEITNSLGSFNTRRHTVKFSTGKINEHFELAGRISQIKSDGYVDRASSDLRSYFLQAAYTDENTLIKALVFGGAEVTYQSWFGVDRFTLENNRTYNFAGEQYDDEGNVIGFYEDQVDNYKQDHAQLHWNQRWTDKWSTNLAFHYTYGRGFFEEYIDRTVYSDFFGAPDATFDFLGFPESSITVNGEVITDTDNVRRRWLDNNFYGTTFSANYQEKDLDVIIGGAWNIYKGDHFGETIWARFAQDSEPFDRLYESDATKTDFNLFTKVNYQLTDKWSLFADMQYRGVGYETEGDLIGRVPIDVDETFNFFNPKAGVTYTVNDQNSLYFSYARASREPNRTDFENGAPKPEKLNDFELGWRLNNSRVRLNTNVYYMRYQDQLVLTGAVDISGFPIRANSGDSYRLGLEVDAAVRLTDKLVWRPNLALSTNRNLDFFTLDDGGQPIAVGDTDISFSPEIVAGNVFTYRPIEKLELSVLSKYVGEQFMNNIESPTAVLDSYFVSDFNVQYEIETRKIFKSIVLTGLVNNVFNEEYESNGYMIGLDPYFYPQAGTNFLVGATLKF